MPILQIPYVPCRLAISFSLFFFSVLKGRLAARTLCYVWVELHLPMLPRRPTLCSGRHVLHCQKLRKIPALTIARIELLAIIPGGGKLAQKRADLLAERGDTAQNGRDGGFTRRRLKLSPFAGGEGG